MPTTNLSDPDRLAAVQASGLLDGPPRESFDRLTRIAAHLLGAPVTLISLVEVEWQSCLSSTGIERSSTPISHSFCRHVVETGEPLVVADARRHPLLCDNPAIAELGSVAYLGVPVHGPGGHVLGALCAVGHEPRAWTTEEAGVLADLAAAVDAELRLRAVTSEAVAQNEHMLAVGAASLDAVVVMADDGVLLDLNAAAVRLFGYSRDEAIGTELAQLLIPETLRAAHRIALARHRRTGVDRERVIGRRAEFMATRADGGEIPIELSVTRTEIAGQVRFTGFVRDLSEVRSAQRAREAAEARTAMVVDAAPMVLFAVDADGVVTHCTGTGLRSLGHRAEELIGRSVLELYAGDEETLGSFRRVLDGASFSTMREAGDVVFETRYRPLRGPDGRVEGAVGVSLDVTERERTGERIQQLAYTDALTGLPNRAALQELASTTLEAHNDTGCRAALLYVNLDDFRSVNDSFGHHAGDQVLRDAASRLRDALGDRGVLGRQGGDEFLIFVADLGDDPGAETERIALDSIAALERPLVHDDLEFTVRASIGASHYPQDGERFEELLHHADMAMYRAKASGQGRYATYLPQGSDARHRLTITTRLRRALAQDELELHYQPLFELGTGRASAVEALLRWNDPERGSIGPLDFIPAAETTGLIVEIGAWVAETAAINGTLETQQDLRRLAAMGVTVVVDDFGAGHSSLTRLRDLPVSGLKIDRGLLQGFPHDAASAAVVGASIALADALELRTVAEGIENEVQRDALAALGCDFGQGFALARPMAAAQATAFLLEHGCPELRERVALHHRAA